MKFHDYPLMGSAFRDNLVRRNPELAEKAKTLKQFYGETLSMIAQHPKIGAVEIATMVEASWLGLRRPYYSVWPHVVHGLSTVPLTLDASKLRLPIDTLCVRFAEADTPTFEGSPLRSVLAQFTDNPRTLQMEADEACGFWSISADVGEHFVGEKGPEAGLSLPHPMTFNMFLRKGVEFEKLLAEVDDAADYTPGQRAALKFAVRIVAGCCLLASDPDIVVPDVLAADRQRYDETGDLKYVEKAQRRGKVGWNVGARLEVDPHYRRAHLGLRWCGKGRTEPRIVPIAGCLVKRQKLKEVPTGYLDDEVCPACGNYRVPQTGICAHCQKAEHDADAHVARTSG